MRHNRWLIACTVPCKSLSTSRRRQANLWRLLRTLLPPMQLWLSWSKMWRILPLSSPCLVLTPPRWDTRPRRLPPRLAAGLVWVAWRGCLSCPSYSVRWFWILFLCHLIWCYRYKQCLTVVLIGSSNRLCNYVIHLWVLHSWLCLLACVLELKYLAVTDLIVWNASFDDLLIKIDVG